MLRDNTRRPRHCAKRISRPCFSILEIPLSEDYRRTPRPPESLNLMNSHSNCKCTNVEETNKSQRILTIRFSFSIMRRHEKLQPFVHRKDAGVLRSELPHMQQAILLLRPTRTQSHLFNLYKRRQKGKSDGKNYNNFLRKYQDMR